MQWIASRKVTERLRKLGKPHFIVKKSTTSLERGVNWVGLAADMPGYRPHDPALCSAASGVSPHQQ